MYNAWGVTWGDSWGWSWGPLHEVEEGRRPRTNPIKLQKIREARVQALHGHASTRARVVRAVGATYVPVVVLPSVQAATVTARTAKTRTKASLSRACGTACVVAAHARTRTAAKKQHFSAGTTARVLPGRAYSFAQGTRAEGGAAAQLCTSHTATTYGERVFARGMQNIRTSTLAAIAAVVTRK